MDGKKIAKIIKLVLGIIGVFAALIVLFLHSYSQRSQLIKSYLNYRYGVKADDSEDVTIFGDEFTLMTEDGINVCGTCDFFGNIKTDSYVNYYYADECTDHIRDEIGDYFSDSVIVYDGIKLSELASLPLKTRAINSYDEYVAATKDAWEKADEHNYYYKISIRVYIRESEYIGNIRDAIAQLKDSDEYFDVYFYTVPDEIFDLHKEKEVHAYFRGKAFDELDDYLDKETAVKLEELIYHQSGCAGKYCQWKQIDVSDNDVSHVEEGPMLVISSTIEGPIDYYNDDRVLGVTYTINWNGTITKSVEYLTSGEVVEGSATLSAGDFNRFYDFAENAYKNDPYRGYYEEVCDGSTYGFTYYPLGISQGVHLYGGYCYSNKELWDMVELAYSYFE